VFLELGKGVHIPKTAGTDFEKSYDDVLRHGSDFDKAGDGKVKEKKESGGGGSGH